MVERATNLNQRQLVHFGQWEKKESIRLLYQDFHRRLLKCCPEGDILDIGGGTAHIKTFRADVVSVDILPFPGIDVVTDAHQLPFPDAAFAGVVLLDVLHHLERPIDFLSEASRVLKPGGRLAMIEPAMTTLARHFYHHFHEEPVDMEVDPFAPVSKNPNRDPFDANQAIPSLLFTAPSARRRLQEVVPALRVQSVKWLSLFAYPMSGGFREWSLMPARLVKPILAVEAKMPSIICKHLGFRMMVVMERL
jgi:SAM-dependent methyltransferase